MVLSRNRFDRVGFRLVLFWRWILTEYVTVLGALRPRPLELLGVLWAVGWGLWVGNPYWEVFPGSSTFRIMAIVAPEWVWGTAMIVLGVQHLCALYNENLIWRYYSSVVAFLIWAFTAIVLMIGNLASTATVTYVMLVSMCGLVMAKLMLLLKDRGEE